MKIRVDGQACLDYINKPIGFVNKEYFIGGPVGPSEYVNYVTSEVAEEDHQMNMFAPFIRRGHGDDMYSLLYQWGDAVSINKFNHDTSKRIIGYVTKKYSDGGLKVHIFGNEEMYSHNNIERYFHKAILMANRKYDTFITEPTFRLSNNFQWYPDYPAPDSQFTNPTPDQSKCRVTKGLSDVPFDDTLDYKVEIPLPPSISVSATKQFTRQGTWHLTNNLNTTVIFGQGVESQTAFYFDGEYMDDPLVYLQGDIYGLMAQKNTILGGSCPGSFETGPFFDNYKVHHGSLIMDTNLVATPYNLLLTENYEFAQAYLENGTLPPDAYLFPLDWENLPTIEFIPTGDEPNDYPDDNDPDDDERDFDPTPNEIVSYTVNQLTNYNWYWLTVPQWSAFISWFWNDIGNYSDFDDIIAKVKGLYNDVASAVIMCRYYPVNYKWITQKRIEDAPTGNIKLGMIEKAGPVQMIDQEYSLRTEDIGHIHIGQKYKSFMDMSPYSQLSLYLPWHGFIDLDMNLFNGHDVYVKALYDYLSGTIQYYIFYDNEVLVNTILCKMAMDIPITLQTKNDRDSAIFNNVSSTIGGLVGAGAGILSGNPIGMTLGITQGVGAFNSANASAPMRLMGNVGESGAYIGCQNCFVVVRRPTIQPSDGNDQTSTKGLTTWKKNVGMLCGYGYKLSSLTGKGFTTCHSPRINFTNSAPLQSEVDEIYNYLEKGVIL